MQTHTVQLRVTLPAELQAYLSAKASRFDLNMSAYVKNLIINDVKDVIYPVYEMSEQTVADLQEAKKEVHAQSLTETNDVSSFLKDL